MTDNQSLEQGTQGVKAVAVFEALKGALVILAGCGLLMLIHLDVQQVAEEIVRHFHLNPASRYPRIFIELSDNWTSVRLWQMAAMSFVYASIRFVEAYGLWRQLRWAEWLSVVSGGIYVPIELYEIAKGPSWIKLTAFLINLIIVIYMARTILKSRKDTYQKMPVSHWREE